MRRRQRRRHGEHLTCSLALVRTVESSVSARRGADEHVEQDAISQPAAAARARREDGLLLTVGRLASERKESTDEAAGV